MSRFSDRLQAAILRKATPLVVGLDPRWQQLPEPCRRASGPHDYVQAARDFFTFCRGIIDVIAPLVPAVKPQSACFEQLGPPGMQCLADVISYARHCGLLVILDAKRNDIGSTSQAYAEGLLGLHGPFGGDALTVSPYLGDDSLRPFFEVAAARDAGLFVLVKTSNPGGGQFQDLICGDRPLYRHVADYVERLACERLGACGYGDVGAVVGATYPEQLVELRKAMPHAWLLVPGLGAQGATGDDVAGAFDANGLGAVVNSSRGVIFAHARPDYAKQFAPENWTDAVATAAREAIAQLPRPKRP